MKFEIQYADLSKVVVDVPDAEVKSWLDGRAKIEAGIKASKTEAARGAVLTAKVV